MLNLSAIHDIIQFGLQTSTTLSPCQNSTKSPFATASIAINNIAPVHVTIVLQTLQLRSDEVQQTLAEQPSIPFLPDSNDEMDSESPVLDSLVSKGLLVVLDMTDFSIRKSLESFTLDSTPKLEANGILGGRKTTVSEKDCLLMSLTIHKVGGPWDLLAEIF